MKDSNIKSPLVHFNASSHREPFQIKQKKEIPHLKPVYFKGFKSAGTISPTITWVTESDISLNLVAPPPLSTRRNFSDCSKLNPLK